MKAKKLSKQLSPRIAKPENTCLLVKLADDPMAYAVSLPTEAMLMLVNVAKGLSERHILTLIEFPGVEFKQSLSCQPIEQVPK